MTFSQFYDYVLSRNINPRSHDAYMAYVQDGHNITGPSYIASVSREQSRRKYENKIDIIKKTLVSKEDIVQALDEKTSALNRRLDNSDLMKIAESFKISYKELVNIIGSPKELSDTVDSLAKILGLSLNDKIKVASLETTVKILKSENAKLIRERIQHTDMLTILEKGLTSLIPLEPIPLPSETNYLLDPGNLEAVLLLSDFHWEERVYSEEMRGLNEYTFEIAKARVEDIFLQATERIHMMQGAVSKTHICLLGDMMNGLINEGQIHRQEGSVRSCLSLADHLAKMIREFAASIPSDIEIHTVSGNHGRLKDVPFYKNYANENLDTFMYEFLRMRLENIIHSFSIDYSAVGDRFQLHNGKWVAMTHGHNFKGGNGFSGVTNTLSRDATKLNINGFNFDYLVLGHFHHEGEVRTFGKQIAFVNGSLIGGTPYSIGAVKAADTPMQTLLFFDDKGYHSKHVLVCGDD